MKPFHPPDLLACSLPGAAHHSKMKPSLFLLAALLLMLPGCSGFQPIKLEHDMDKEKPLDYREGDWIPKNT